MNKYFIALSGAKKNLGDFLIVDRALNLLRNIGPDFEFHTVSRDESLDDLEYINNSQGIIILGGPGVVKNMFPKVYRLNADLDSIQVPIHTLGSGWKGIPGDKTTERLMVFSDNTKKLLNKISSYGSFSVRDIATKRLLNINNYSEVELTGCPVWYDIKNLNKEFKSTNAIKNIVFTPAQSIKYKQQSIKIMQFLKSHFHNCNITVSFHRGIGKVDDYTSDVDAENTSQLAKEAERLGFIIKDVSYNLDKINFYDSQDFHIGYRVHGHLYFLSKRLPSLLIHEDGRGVGVSETLNSPGIDAFTINKFTNKFFKKFRYSDLMLKLHRKFSVKIKKDVIEELKTELEKVNDNNFKSIQKRIDSTYDSMNKFIINLLYKY